MKTKLSKKDMIEIIGISDSLYNQILNEQRILSDDTLYKINKQFGINENSYFAYTIDPNIMINHISSLQLENFNKKASL
ncbi:Helix-turn-helix domain protein [compost metagenome]